MQPVNESFYVSGQITIAQLDDIKAQGFDAIICARPNGEEPGQPAAEDIQAAALDKGLAFVWVPMNGPVYSQEQVNDVAALIESSSKVLGYCRSGNRANIIYQAAVG